MDRRNCISYSIPSVHDLLDTKINDDDLNIEDGLSAPDNENLFMIASMAFLQKQLKKKLGFPDGNNPEPNKVYSDMLLFETRSGEQRERFYIRLKNCEKFDNIKYSETSIPESALSKEQVLPLAKRPKLKLSSIFRAMSKSHSKRKNASTFANCNSIPHNSHNQTDPCEIIKSYISIESCFSDKENWTNEMRIKCRQNETDKKILSLTNVSIKKSISENHRLRMNESSICTRDENVSFSSYETDVVSETPKLKLRSYKMKRQQSKLSVCIEDETESENEFSKELSSKISYNNFPDEVKANLSPEVLQNIISQMIVYLEETPEKENKT